MRRPPTAAHRAAVALVSGIAVLLLAGPAALAQEGQREPAPPPWTGSSFDAPFDEGVHELRDDRLEGISGLFRLDKPEATSEIVRVTVGVVDDDSDEFEPDAGCALPDPVEIPSDGTSAADSVDELAFEVDRLRVPCNGRYLLEAWAETNVEDTSHTLRATVVVEVLPPAVTNLAASSDDASQQVTVTWDPVPAADLPADAYGYLLERAGPQSEDGTFGIFGDLVVVDVQQSTAVDDVPQPGTYRYRVRTVRDGPEGPVLSSIIDGDVRTVSLQAPPPTTSSTTAPSTTRAPQVGTVIPRSPQRTTRLSPPTTADTGFEGELDYGELPVRSTTTQDVPELASEDPQAGQSVIRDEGGEGVDLIVPAAGALVLIGWAGHIAYMNRLAKQL